VKEATQETQQVITQVDESYPDVVLAAGGPEALRRQEVVAGLLAELT
jgi:hypothetical protein